MDKVMKIKVKRSITEGVFLVDKKEITKYIKDSDLKSLHVINPNSSLFTNYDCTVENALKKIDEADSLAIVTGRAAENNLGHSLSVVKNDDLFLFNIGDVAEKLSITELSEKEIKEYFDSLLKTNSRKKLDLCENDNCYRRRKNGSKYCQHCADEHKKINKET
jgi:hypothetical protein